MDVLAEFLRGLPDQEEGLPFSPLALDELPDIQEHDQRPDVEVALAGEPGGVEGPAQHEVEPERDPVQALRANTRRTISRARAGQPQKKGPRRRPADTPATRSAAPGAAQPNVLQRRALHRGGAALWHSPALRGLSQGRFTFPDAEPAPLGSSTPAAAGPTSSDTAATGPAPGLESEDYDEYGPTVDPALEGGIEERFFFGKDGGFVIHSWSTPIRSNISHEDVVTNSDRLVDSSSATDGV
ncbi:hypothetical protein FJT64_007412 [Amphibalanus amphitrite]|uniref:Uncharacterized protein n=1 Tax=Amphibalanus amphitrite TaxID=1232801 RepID=A0A6A4VU80_AMPAM|nr:hypothetical protein FJT64_007412 [Amphibalanus amphitrite]